MLLHSTEQIKVGHKWDLCSVMVAGEMLLAQVPIPAYSQIIHTRSYKSVQSPAKPLQHIHTAQKWVLSKAEPVQMIWVRFPTRNLQPCHC